MHGAYYSHLSQYGSHRWPGAYLVPGHLQLSWCCGLQTYNLQELKKNFMESRNLVNLKTGKSNIRALGAKRTHVHDLFIMSSSRTWTLPHHSNDRVEYAPDFELTKRKSILDLSFCKLQHIYWNWEYFWVNSPCFTFCCIMLWFGIVQLNPCMRIQTT